MANEAFRKGMLTCLAVHGITPEEFGRAVMMHKQAAGGFATLLDVGGAGKTIKNVSGFILQWPLTAAALIGIPAGLGLGAMHHLATRPDYSRKVEDFKNDQLLRELRFQIDKAKDLEARRKGRKFLQLEVE